MIRKASGFIRASLVVSALLVGATFVTGCSNSGSTDPASTAAPTPPAAPTASPAPPAAPAKMKFDQLTLQSPAKRKTDPNGLVFYSFSYSDRDGKVYKCNLPEAMAQGEFTTDGWIRTFNLYREPTVIKQIKIKRDANKDGLNDFPFIAPKATVPAGSQHGSTPTGSPTYPGMPAPGSVGP